MDSASLTDDEIYLMPTNEFCVALNSLIKEGTTGFSLDGTIIELWYQGPNFQQVVWLLTERGLNPKIISGDRVYWLHKISKW